MFLWVLVDFILFFLRIWDMRSCREGIVEAGTGWKEFSFKLKENVKPEGDVLSSRFL